MKYNAQWIPIQEFVGVRADGFPGDKTLAGIAEYLDTKDSWAAVQKRAGVAADGIPGPATAKAVSKLMKLVETPAEASPQPSKRKYPTQAQVRANTSVFGRPGSNLVTIKLPYPMRLSWDKDSTVTRLTCHKEVADSVTQIFTDTLNVYGMARIKELGLDLYGGCYNDRSIAGGKSKSMHSWGIAIDMDPDRNGMKDHAPKANFSKPEYRKWWEIVESNGATSLGRERDYDWMHFQFASL
ncbi:MAG: M15 family metallopeptidase [Tannerellaceae bacterium]